MRTKLTRLDRAALLTIAGLLALLGLLLWSGNPAALEVELLNPAETLAPGPDGVRASAAVGPLGPLRLRFSAPVDPQAVQRSFSLTPAVAGAWRVIDGQRLDFIPARPLDPRTNYRLALSPGRLGRNGEQLKTGAAWEVHLRAPRVIYLRGKPAQLWSAPVGEGAALALTRPDDRVYDYAAAPDGEQIAVTLYNESGGIDLWLLDREGRQRRLALDCGPDQCSTPAWSPDGRMLAYTKRAAPLTPTAAAGAPRTWILDLDTGRAAPAFSDPQTLSYGPAWSPDGRYLSGWDGMNGGIRLLDRQDGSDRLVPTMTGAAGSWSPGGTQLLFTRYEEIGGLFFSYIYSLEPASGLESLLLKSEGHDSAYGAPAWAPESGLQPALIAVSRRPSPETPARDLLLLDPATWDEWGRVGGEPDAIYSFYQWDPYGTALTLQRTWLGAAPRDEVLVYDLQSGELTVVAEGGIWPQWLP